MHSKDLLDHKALNKALRARAEAMDVGSTSIASELSDGYTRPSFPSHRHPAVNLSDPPLSNRHIKLV